jgi:Lon-like ATP-dependent protease
MVPKLLVSHNDSEMPPFVDATGAHAGALLGDVKHDPFQSGGLETPAHERLEVGAIHKASKGVLFVDEINMLRIESQQSLLTALQEGEFAITGQSERSSGAMVKSEAVPCDFVLVCAGNLDAVQGMHPALRSRIRGYGYEVYMKSTMEDTHSNREKLVRFVAQEVAKDKKIPHFDMTAVGEIVKEAQRRAGRRGQLTLRLRELGGLIRVAGDIATEESKPMVTSEHVLAAKKIARSLEQQVADRYIEARKEYKTFLTEGSAVGVVNGLAALNAESNMAEFSGVVLPIVAEVTPAQTKNGGKIIATGRLGEIAKEAVQNVSALIKKYTGEDISNHDVHVQFVGAYEGVEGDSASISVATAVISAFEEVPVDQTVAMTGSLSVRGKVLPVGGVTAKIEAAAESGLKKVLIPKENIKDVVLEEKYVGNVEIIPVENLSDVLSHALVGGTKKEGLLRKLTAAVESAAIPAGVRPVPR